MRVKCLVTYDGTAFYGWQIQSRDRSVQQVIQEALYKITGEQITIHGSGRTDAHVHATGQVFHFDARKELPEKQWQRAINHFLPPDVYIIDTWIVDDSFHARYSALAKEYRYQLSMKRYDPFMHNYIYQHGRTLDVQRMRQAARLFEGQHDFASFCVYDQYGNTIRTIYKIDIKENDGIVTFTFIGDGFRRYMVRHIVGGLIQVGGHRRTIAFLEELMASRGAKKCLFKAKPEGLYLEHVFYDQKELDERMEQL